MKSGEDDIEISDLDVEILVRSGSMKIRDLNLLLGALTLFIIQEQSPLKSYCTQIEQRTLQNGEKSLSIIRTKYHIE